MEAQKPTRRIRTLGIEIFWIATTFIYDSNNGNASKIARKNKE